MKYLLNTALLTTLILNAVWPVTVQAASFDCTKAGTNIEKMICADTEVSRLDEKLAQAYKAALGKAVDKESFKQKQRVWLKKQRNVCKTAACLAKVYPERIAELYPNAYPVSTAAASAASSDNVISISGASDKKKQFSIYKGQQYQLCRDYLELMNRSELNPKSSCGLKYTFDEQAKKQGFRDIPWVEVDIKQHENMLLHHYIYEMDNDISELEAEKRTGRFYSSYIKEDIKLWEAYFDLNMDSVKDHVFKLRIRNCSSTSDIFIFSEDFFKDKHISRRTTSGEPFIYNNLAYLEYGTGISEGFGSQTYVSMKDVCSYREVQ